MTITTTRQHARASRSQIESFWRREPRPLTALLVSVASAVVIIGLWSWASRPAGVISPLLLPPPVDIVDAFLRLLERPYLGTSFGSHIIASLGTVLAGWVAAALIGLPLGIWIGWSKRAR